MNVAPSTSEFLGQELERLLASQEFKASERTSQLLRFLVEKTIVGQGHLLKEHLIAVEVYDRGPGFDPRLDSVVRVEMRRLRAKLHRYYSREGRGGQMRIEIPSGTYTPALIMNGVPAAAVERLDGSQVQVPKGLRLRLAVTVAAVIGAVAVVWYSISVNARHLPPLPAMVVASFESASPAPEDVLFVQGLRAAFVAGLAKAGTVAIVPAAGHPSGSRRFSAHTMAAGFVLYALVQRADRRVSVSMSLTGMPGGETLWSHTYVADVRDLAALQDEMVKGVSDGIPNRKAYPSRPRRAE